MSSPRALRRNRSAATRFAAAAPERRGPRLEDGARVAVVGGGPAGSFFATFLLRMARDLGLDLSVDILEPRSFGRGGPGGCNHCGGIVSESLVQMLATEGINLPTTLVQRAIDSYVLHMDVGTVRIETPRREKRIAAVFRGSGPRGVPISTGSFDLHLQEMAVRAGARVVRRLVSAIDRPDGRPRLVHAEGPGETYDLVALATGVNSRLLGRVESASLGYRAPRTVSTYISEFPLGAEAVRTHLGSSMHVFLLDLPRLEFAALIPKGEVVTLVLLGDDVDPDLVAAFLAAPEVRACFPPAADLPRRACQCAPLINVGGPVRPWGDRLVALGDAGVTRLYKDGIGAAYRTAKAAAVTAVFEGIGAEDFERHFWPACRAIARDNSIGRFLFAFNGALKSNRLSRGALLRMTAAEQRDGGAFRPMSRVLWDLFSGSAPYREILGNAMDPRLIGALAWNLTVSVGAAMRPGHASSADARGGPA